VVAACKSPSDSAPSLVESVQTSAFPAIIRIDMDELVFRVASAHFFHAEETHRLAKKGRPSK
jgi:hypothetical protein